MERKRICVVARLKGVHLDDAHGLVYEAIAGEVRQHRTAERRFAAQFLRSRRRWLRQIHHWKTSGMLTEEQYARLRWCRTSGFILNVAKSRYRCFHSICPFCTFVAMQDVVKRCAPWLRRERLDVVEVALPYTSIELSNEAYWLQVAKGIRDYRTTLLRDVKRSVGSAGFTVLRVIPRFASSTSPAEFHASFFVVGTDLGVLRSLNDPLTTFASLEPRNALQRVLAYPRDWLRLRYEEVAVVSAWRKSVRLSWFGSPNDKY